MWGCAGGRLKSERQLSFAGPLVLRCPFRCFFFGGVCLRSQLPTTGRLLWTKSCTKKSWEIMVGICRESHSRVSQVMRNGFRAHPARKSRRLRALPLDHPERQDRVLDTGAPPPKKKENKRLNHISYKEKMQRCLTAPQSVIRKR